jgi:hypothetical protein
MAYKDKIQKIGDKKRRDKRIELMRGKSFLKLGGTKKDQEEMAEKVSKRKNSSKKNAMSTIKAQMVIDDTKRSNLGESNEMKDIDIISDKNLSKREGSFKFGGRVNFRGGGCTTKGINKKAYGKNS